MSSYIAMLVKTKGSLTKQLEFLFTAPHSFLPFSWPLDFLPTVTSACPMLPRLPVVMNLLHASTT